MKKLENRVVTSEKAESLNSGFSHTKPTKSSKRTSRDLSSLTSRKTRKNNDKIKETNSDDDSMHTVAITRVKSRDKENINNQNDHNLTHKRHKSQTNDFKNGYKMNKNNKNNKNIKINNINNNSNDKENEDTLTKLNGKRIHLSDNDNKTTNINHNSNNNNNNLVNESLSDGDLLGDNSNVINKKKKIKKSIKSKLELKKQKELRKITKQHPEFELSYDMMLGIRFAVSTSEPSITMPSSTGTHQSSETDSDDDLVSEFERAVKFTFPSHGSNNTPAHEMRDFKFKDYCPEIFRQLRDWFGIETGDYLTTISGSFNLLEFLSNSKSGSFFFFSHNKQFVIKTMTHSECLFLRKILPNYFKYVSRQPYTLITKFFGMHRVTVKKRKPIYFIIMSSVFYTSVPIHIQYDLKGSTYGRKAKDKEKKSGAILKDLNFIENKQIIKIGKEKTKKLKQQLRNDTEFLRKLKIMDYSLLVGISYRDEWTKDNTVDTKDTKDNKNIKDIKDNKDSKEQQKNNVERKVNITRRSSNSVSQAKNELKIKIVSDNDDIKTNTKIVDDGYEGENELEDKKENDSKRRKSLSKSKSKSKSIPKINNNNSGSSSDNDDDKPIKKLTLDVQNSNVRVKKPQYYHKSKPSDFDLNVLVPNTPNITDDLEDEPFSFNNLETNTQNNEFNVTPIKPSPKKKEKKLDLKEQNIKLNSKLQNIDTNINSNNEKINNNKTNNNKKVKLKESQINNIKTNELSNNYSNDSIKDSFRNVTYNKGNLYGKRVLRDINEITSNNNNRSDYNSDYGGAKLQYSPFTDELGGMCYTDKNGNKGNEIYFVGIIDILQKYNRKKKMESFLKSFSHKRDTISAVDPELYARRFNKFFSDKVE